MSRGYRIALPLEIARGHVTGKDTLTLAVELMPILGEADMKDTLTSTLKQAGWQEGEHGTLHKELEGGARATINSARTEVTVTVAATRDLRTTGRTQKEAKAALSQQQERAESSVQREATERLAGVEAGVRTELDAAIQRTYVEALKQKAQTLGQVESVLEGTGADGSLEITIKVRA